MKARYALLFTILISILFVAAGCTDLTSDPNDTDSQDDDEGDDDDGDDDDGSQDCTCRQAASGTEGTAAVALASLIAMVCVRRIRRG